MTVAVMIAQPFHITDYLHNIHLMYYQLNKAGFRQHIELKISRLTQDSNLSIFIYKLPEFIRVGGFHVQGT